jgi:hypothetical protein
VTRPVTPGRTTAGTADSVPATTTPLPSSVPREAVKDQLRRLLQTSTPADAHEAKTLFGNYVHIARIPETDRLRNTICERWTEVCAEQPEGRCEHLPSGTVHHEPRRAAIPRTLGATCPCSGVVVGQGRADPGRQRCCGPIRRTGPCAGRLPFPEPGVQRQPQPSRPAAGCPAPHSVRLAPGRTARRPERPWAG